MKVFRVAASRQGIKNVQKNESFEFSKLLSATTPNERRTAVLRKLSFHFSHVPYIHYMGR